MAANNAVQWSSNVNPNDVSSALSGGGTVITYTPKTAWPVGRITWDIRNFHGADGTAVFDFNTQGEFTTSADGTNPCGPGTGTKASGVSIFKTITYQQLVGAPPAPKIPDAASFFASLTSPENNPVTQASLTIPGGKTEDMLGFGGSFFFSESFDAQAPLDAAYPTGQYTVNAQRQNGATASVTVSLSNLDYPPTPQIVNLAQLQSPSLPADVVVQFNGIPGATSQDSISFVVHDQTGIVFQLPEPCATNGIPNTATSLVIPAGILVAGKTYDASLTFFHFANQTTSIPDLPASAGFSKETQFKIGGGGSVTPPSAPKFTLIQRLSDGSIHLQLTGQANALYVIQATGDFLNWLPLKTSSSSTGVIDFTDTTNVGASWRIYRATTP